MKGLITLMIAALMSSSLALAADKSEKTKETKRDRNSWMSMSAETRRQMADMHQKMAECLKSDKSLSECRDNMMANCPMMKDGQCPMKGMMGMMHDDHDGCMNH